MCSQLVDYFNCTTGDVQHVYTKKLRVGGPNMWTNCRCDAPQTAAEQKIETQGRPKVG